MAQRSREDWKCGGVEVAAEVDPGKIAENAVIYPGSRIEGAKTSIGPGSVIGSEAPAIIENCQLGRSVSLKGGYFSGAVFFDGSGMGSGAHVRSGTILEEQAGGAHTVGFKQTILLPFVTAGSLINFCDLLMAGGTSRKNHSEVGSSYVHFNYTPHQDKATPSLIGDVPKGVFLNQKPVFIGGQGGLVGPARIAYGSVIAAGGVCRRDVLKENQLHIPASPQSETQSYEIGLYRGIDRIVQNNLAYIGNIFALREWYRQIRIRFVRDSFDQAVVDGGLSNLDLILNERLQRLEELAEKMEKSIRLLAKHAGKNTEMEAQKKLLQNWPDMKAACSALASPEAPAVLVDELNTSISYVEAIQSVSPAACEAGRAWLQCFPDGVEQIWSC